MSLMTTNAAAPEAVNVQGEQVDEQNLEAGTEADAASGEIKDPVEKAVADEKARQEAEALKAAEAEKAEKDQFATKFAALSRKERAVARKEKELQARISTLDQKEKDYERLLKLEETILSNPLVYLREKGYDFSKLAEIELNSGNLTPEMQMKQLEEKWQRKLEEEVGSVKQKLQEKEAMEAQKNVDQRIGEFVNEIETFVESNSDKYELINIQGAIQDVYQLIEDRFAQTIEYDENGEKIEGTGEILSIEEACDYIERHLENEVKKFTAAKKFNLNKTAAPSAPAAESKPAPRNSATLSNNQSAQIPTQGTHKLSKEESLKRAAALLKFN